MTDRMKAQPFGLTKDGKFLLASDLDQPQETLSGILSKVGEDVVSKIDDNAWVIEMIEEHVPFPENFSRVFVAVSRGENSVSNFMNGVLFASDVLNTNRESDK
jgi:hypothetical protein